MNIESQTSVVVQRLFIELTAAAQPSAAPAEFFGNFLPRLATACESVAGSVWLQHEEQWRLEAQWHWEEAGAAKYLLSAEHRQVLEQVLADGRPALIAPMPIARPSATSPNSTPYPLLLAPLTEENETVGVVELLQPPSPDGQPRGHARLLTDCCQIASQYLQARAWHVLKTQRRDWRQWQEFQAAMHDSLEVEKVAQVIANEGRLFLQCDRVCVATRRKGIKLRAISGQQIVDRRSVAVRTLQELVARVLAVGEPLVLPSALELAPQINESLQKYQDSAPMRRLLILPLGPGRKDESAVRPAEMHGALIVEQADEEGSFDELQSRAALIVPTAAAALRNALAHETVPLLPLWRALDRSRWLVETKTLPKTALACGVLLAIALALTFIPAELKLHARGVVQPSLRREVFAETDGRVRTVLVDHGAEVEQGEILIELEDVNLNVEIQNMEGERAQAAERFAAYNAAVLGDAPPTTAERTRLHGERAAAQHALQAISRELELLRAKEQLLRLRSPLAGRVVTWNVRDSLMERPVRRGDALLTVMAPDSPWELEVRLPDQYTGHVVAARSATQELLTISFVAANQPDQVLQGTLRDVQQRAENRGDDGNCVLLKVDIDKSELRDARPGTEVTAHVHCGQHPLGYVWLHDVWDFFQTRVLFRLR